MDATAFTTHPAFNSNELIDRIGRVFIIAYKESTQQLEEAFAKESLPCEVLRQTDRPDYQNYAAIYRCMLNHSHAWERAAQETKPTLIVEADFVPVVGLGKLPLPFNPSQRNVGIAWLYTCAPQLYSVSQEGFAEGFSTGLVAYIVTPGGARALSGLVEEVTHAHGTDYYNFDSDIDQFLRARNLKNYIPFRNYGEHGGKSNPEHRHNGMSGIHRADVLYNRLAFTPAYVSGRKHAWLQFLSARSQARLKGMGRLLGGKFLRLKVIRTSKSPFQLISFAVRRQVLLRL